MRTFLISALFSILFVSVSPSAQASDLFNQVAQSNDALVCMKTCLDKYGEDNKAACAQSCGLAGGGGGVWQKATRLRHQIQTLFGIVQKGRQELPQNVPPSQNQLLLVSTLAKSARLA